MSALASHESQSSVTFQPNYELDRAEISQLSQRLLAERPANGNDRFVAYEFDGDDPYSNLGRSIELTVFDETFPDNKVEDLEREYGPYERASSFFVVMDQKSQQPIGALRIIRNSEAGLKTLNDIAGEPLTISTESFMNFHQVTSLDNVWDVGTVAVLPEFRTTGIKSAIGKNPQPNIMLYRSLYAKARYEGIDHFVSVIDHKAHRGLKLLGVPFVPINDSEPFSYVGSESSIALYGYVPEFFDIMDARYKRIQEAHPLKSKLLARPLGQLMLGERTDDKLYLNY